jgi:hypothetical protein
MPPPPRRRVTLTFNRDLTDQEVEKLRQQTDALHATAMLQQEAAHHHDAT